MCSVTVSNNGGIKGSRVKVGVRVRVSGLPWCNGKNAERGPQISIAVQGVRVPQKEMLYHSVGRGSLV